MSVFDVSRSTALRVAKRFVERNMVDRVRVVRTVGDPFETGDFTVGTAIDQVLYEGPARVYTVGSGGSLDDGELVYMSGSRISLPLSVVNTMVDDLFEIVEHGDPSMVGRWFRCLNVDAGGLFPVVRSHTVTSVQRSSSWRGNPV